MLTWCATGLVAAAVLLAGRWTLRRRDGLGRARPFPTVSVVLLLGLGLAAAVPVVRHHRLESRLSAVASVLVGQPVRVHCQTTGAEMVDVGAELGWVSYGPDGRPEHATLIKHAQCGDLAAYLGSDHADPSDAEVVAVHVLSHEARHMAGTTSEALAECQAVQRDAETARLLGATDVQGAELARRYWRTVYPRMSADYVSGDCAGGGPWDERLPGAPWAAPGPAASGSASASRTAG